MNVVRIQKIGDEVALVLDEEVLRALGAKIGDVLQPRQTSEGIVFDPEASEAVKIGRSFLVRYRKTFDALAK